jgi:hypothetical protein
MIFSPTTTSIYYYCGQCKQYFKLDKVRRMTDDVVDFFHRPDGSEVEIA